MRRAAMLFFCACWVVAVASLGLRAEDPQSPSSAQPQAPAPGGQSVRTGAAPQSEQALVKQYCVTCHNARAVTGGRAVDAHDPGSS